jgi:signal transduction histidine kinase
MKLLLSFFWIFFNTAFAINFPVQKPKQDSLFTLIEKEKYNEVEKVLSKMDTLTLSETQKADYYYAKAKVLDIKGVHDISFKYYLNARKKYLSVGKLEEAMLVCYQLAFAIIGDDPNIYIQEMEDYLKKNHNNKIASRFYYLKAYENILIQENEKALEMCNLANEATVATRDSLYMHKVNSFIGLIYSQILNNPLKAIEHEMKLYSYLERNNITDQIANSKINQAAVYYTLKEHRKAIKLLKEGLNIDVVVFEKGMKGLIYEALAINYEALKDYEKAIKYIHLSKEYADSLNLEKQNIAIREYQIQYETEKKQLENVYLKQENVLLGEKQRANRILFFVTLGLFIALLTASYFIVKYLLRKKKIAEQEKIIEQQKSENLLKTQEMNIIDAMIEGQEKERQLIAQDLHDNLGSMLASLRLNFENLRSQTAQENYPLFEKANGLINDAYQNVRRLAHAKNSGVIADRGLIPALKILAEKTSVPKKFEIEIQSFGMNSRLDLTLEITVFRAIQELVTNCIKHASASKVLISLTQHQNEITIMVEDNGKGFAKNITEGMGLSNIRKKIKSYGGTFDIDSSSKGTTIIINIPI